MLIICDFDGTVSSRDTLNHLTIRFMPDEDRERLDGALLAGRLNLREVIGAEMESITVGHEEVVAAAVEGAPLRPGFVEFFNAVETGGHELVILSAGFHQLIRPMLASGGIDPDRVEIVANEVEWAEGGGGQIVWRELPVCDTCEEECKRADVEAWRARVDHDELVYIGDGYSDRCAAELADRIFARDHLAEWLTRHDVPFERFEDFRDVNRALGFVPVG